MNHKQHKPVWRHFENQRISFQLLLLLTACMLLLSGCDEQSPHTESRKTENAPASKQQATQPPNDWESNDEPAPRISPPTVAAARDQIGNTTIYDGSYVGLDYPGGDVPIERGVCTDVVIRAMRDAHSIDLQQLVHEDMKTNFSAYPTIWGLSRPDKNIDHRRVPNLQTYFARHGYELTNGSNPSDFMPGDLVTCMVGGNLPHIMIVSDSKTIDGVPLVIHNIGRGTVEEDRLFDFPITGQYRIHSR